MPSNELPGKYRNKGRKVLDEGSRAILAGSAHIDDVKSVLSGSDPVPRIAAVTTGAELKPGEIAQITNEMFPS